MSNWRAKRRAQRAALEAEEATVLESSNIGSETLTDVMMGEMMGSTVNADDGFKPKMSAAKRLKMEREAILASNTSRSARRVARGADKLNDDNNEGDSTANEEVRGLGGEHMGSMAMP
jgi:hypothetical protein